MIPQKRRQAMPEQEKEFQVPFERDGGKRQFWMKILAKAQPESLENAWIWMGKKPSYRRLRGPEIGLILLRGREDGKGDAFHLGEMTVTRCSVQIDGGNRGCAYLTGRSLRHAELSALFDALLQDPEHQDLLMKEIIYPLEQIQRHRQALEDKKVSPTRVEFFTMVRGEG
jgi:alpha-D-ribose 1-methylphosphonate 5-triphosphate synthase subunit PhnG